MTILLRILSSIRTALGLSLALSVLSGCASPQTTVPIQAGGTRNQQQTGGLQTRVPIHVTPVITVPAGSPSTTQPAAGP